MIIVDIIDDMLSHDRAKAIKANLMPDSEIHCIQNVSTKKCTPHFEVMLDFHCGKP